MKTLSQDFSLITTRKCNWSCSYCVTDTHNNKLKEITLDDVKKNIKIISDGTDVSLSGGEPGLASPEIIEYILKTLKEKECSVCVLTNGVFFKTFGYLDYLVDGYVWHVSPDLGLVRHTIPENINPKKIEYTIVVDDNNIKHLDDFLDLNPFVTKITAADFYYVNGKPGSFLSKKNAILLVKKYKHMLAPGSIGLLLHRCTTYQSDNFNLPSINVLGN